MHMNYSIIAHGIVSYCPKYSRGIYSVLIDRSYEKSNKNDLQIADVVVSAETGANGEQNSFVQIFTSYSQVIPMRIAGQNFLNCPRQAGTHVRAERCSKIN